MVTRFSSARVQAALATPTSYRRRLVCTFQRGGGNVVLEPISASFTQDVRRRARWNGRLSFTGSDLIPNSPRDLLAPFGTTVSVSIGLELLDGTTALVPYGVYDIDSTNVEISPDERTIDIELIDLSDRIDRYRFETPFTLSASTTLSAMINTVVLNRIGRNPSIDTIPIILSYARTLGLETETGPWDEVLDILATYGLTAFYRRDGLIGVSGTSPTASTPYALTSIGSLSADFDTRPANVVVARGESADDTIAPVQAVAMDTDPGSATYAGTGPGTSSYGRRTEYFSSPLLTTVSEAQAAAQSILNTNLGAGATYTLKMPFDPTVDPFDVVSVAGANYAIDAVTVDFIGETTAQVRRL